MAGMRPVALFATVMLLLVVFSRPVSAETVVFGTLEASRDDGSLAGTTFSVTFSYDADEVAPEGDSYVTLRSFDFILLDVPFTRDDIFHGGQAIFHDGVLDNVTASFQVRLPPNSPVNNITFGFGGSGIIAYTDLDGQYGSGSFTIPVVSDN